MTTQIVPPNGRIVCERCGRILRAGAEYAARLRPIESPAGGVDPDFIVEILCLRCVGRAQMP